MSNIVHIDFKKKQREEGDRPLAEAIKYIRTIPNVELTNKTGKYRDEEIATFYEEQIDPLFYNIQQTVDVDFIWIPSPFDKDNSI